MTVCVFFKTKKISKSVFVANYIVIKLQKWSKMNRSCYSEQNKFAYQ